MTAGSDNCCLGMRCWVRLEVRSLSYVNEWSEKSWVMEV